MTRTLNSREKIFAGMTASVAVCLLFYYGFLGGFVEKYRTTSADIVRLEEDLAYQSQVLTKRDAVAARYDEIKESVLQGRAGQSPQAVFTEQLSAVCGPGTTIDPHKVEPVPDADGFAIIVLHMGGFQGDLARVMGILREFQERKWLVQYLQITTTRGRVTANPLLGLDVYVAQLVRDEDLDASDLSQVQRMRGLARPRSAPATGNPRFEAAPEE